MSYCKQCGIKLEQDTKFCPSCGTVVSDQPKEAASAYTPPIVPKAAVKPDEKDVQDNKAMGILAYISLLVLVPIFAAKESKFARFHANQGLVLLICEAAYGILYAILSWVFLAISWRLYFLVVLLGLVYAVFVVFSVFGIIAAAKGQKKDLPFIGKFKILK